jgi:hypothetical protein
MTIDPDARYKPHQVAAMLLSIRTGNSMSTDSIRRHIKAGELEAHRSPGTRWLWVWGRDVLRFARGRGIPVRR